jgi:hypothetical protein
MWPCFSVGPQEGDNSPSTKRKHLEQFLRVVVSNKTVSTALDIPPKVSAMLEQ